MKDLIETLMTFLFSEIENLDDLVVELLKRSRQQEEDKEKQLQLS